ncbi:MAG: FMN-binding protein [Prolixibacteraceae bacterium]|nr:FMN-binding protein [Prolixibacteraceae bacterium]
MSKLFLLLAIWLMLLLATLTASAEGNEYTGRSQSVYNSEPYMGFVTISFNVNEIDSVRFQIVDTLNNEVFGPDYEKHYPDNAHYRQQCRNDWQGVLHYPKELLKKQSIDSVDAVSGATWSYNIFKAAVNDAFKKNKGK